MKSLSELGISPAPWRTGHDGLSVICGDTLKKTFDMVSFGRTPYNDRARAIYKANDRLIASAPELYEALRGLIEWRGLRGDKEEQVKSAKEFCSLIAKGRAALAKASGEEGANTIDENNRIAKKCSSELLKKAEHAIEQFERTHGEDVSIVTETDTDDDSLVIKIFGSRK